MTANVLGLNNLKFPIIAKPDAGHSGSGIEIFETAEDLAYYLKPY